MALRSRLAAAAIVAINLSSRARAMPRAGESGDSWELPRDGFCRAGPMLSTLHPCRNPTGSSGCDFFFLILQCIFFFHMTSLRLGYVFKSIISDNHCWSNQVAVIPGWFWSSFLVAWLIHCPLCVFLTNHWFKDHLSPGCFLKTFHWHLPIRARKPQGQTCRIGLNRLEESPADHSGAFFQGVVGDQIFQQ